MFFQFIITQVVTFVETKNIMKFHLKIVVISLFLLIATTASYSQSQNNDNEKVSNLITKKRMSNISRVCAEDVGLTNSCMHVEDSRSMGEKKHPPQNEPSNPRWPPSCSKHFFS